MLRLQQQHPLQPRAHDISGRVTKQKTQRALQLDHQLPQPQDHLMRTPGLQGSLQMKAPAGRGTHTHTEAHIPMLCKHSIQWTAG